MVRIRNETAGTVLLLHSRVSNLDADLVVDSYLYVGVEIVATEPNHAINLNAKVRDELSGLVNGGTPRCYFPSWNDTIGHPKS